MRIFISILSALLLSSAAHARTWTDTNGNKLEADIVKANKEKVMLKVGEQSRVMPVTFFSEPDQAYIQEWIESQQMQQVQLRKEALKASAENHQEMVRQHREMVEKQGAERNALKEQARAEKKERFAAQSAERAASGAKRRAESRACSSCRR